jgi:hypothetical protein
VAAPVVTEAGEALQAFQESSAAVVGDTPDAARRVACRDLRVALRVARLLLTTQDARPPAAVPMAPS